MSIPRMFPFARLPWCWGAPLRSWEAPTGISIIEWIRRRNFGRAGKATVFVVSGDNSSHAYNEPEWMKQALVERGVPEDRIVCDFAGLRTLDSVVRMKEVFGVSTMIVVSQEFHNERALAIAAHEEMDAWAVSAPDVPNRSSRIKSWFRERAARVWMMLDLWLWGREPRFLGEPVAVPEVKGEK